MNSRLVVVAAVAAAVLLFLLQNTAVVEIRFLFWSFAMSRALFLLVVFAAGAVAGWLGHGIYRHRHPLS